MTSIREQFNKAFLDEDRLINQKVYNNVNKFVKTFDSNINPQDLIQPSAQRDSVLLNQTQADVSVLINKINLENRKFSDLNNFISVHSTLVSYFASTSASNKINELSEKIDSDYIVAEYNKDINNFFDPKMNPVNREQFKSIFVDVEKPNLILLTSCDKYIIALLELELKYEKELSTIAPANKKALMDDYEKSQIYLKNYLMRFIKFHGIINFIAESLDSKLKKGFVTITPKIIEQEFIRSLKYYKTIYGGQFNQIIDYFVKEATHAILFQPIPPQIRLSEYKELHAKIETRTLNLKEMNNNLQLFLNERPNVLVVSDSNPVGLKSLKSTLKKLIIEIQTFNQAFQQNTNPIDEPAKFKAIYDDIVLKFNTNNGSFILNIRDNTVKDATGKKRFLDEFDSYNRLFTQDLNNNKTALKNDEALYAIYTTDYPQYVGKGKRKYIKK